jgi:predicted nucleotidyltransferase
MLPSQVLQKRRAEVLEIMKRYPKLDNLRVIGSVARREDTERSDIDFIVDPLPGTTLFDVGGLHEDLEELLGVPVDVITTGEHIRTSLKEAIARDAVSV